MGDGEIPPDSFLGGLRGEERTALLDCARIRRFRRGETLLAQGALGDGVAMIASGTVKVVIERNGRPTLIALRFAGELVGELATLDGGRRCADVIALTDGEAAMIDGDVIRALMAASPGAARRIHALLTARLRDLSADVVQHATRDVTGRMAARVVELADRYGTTQPNGSIRIDPPISRAELASWAGGSREAGARALRILREADWIETPGRSIVVRDRAALVRFFEA